MSKPTDRLWPAAVVLAMGLAAIAIAMVGTLFALGIDGRPDDVILVFGGHTFGGWADTLTGLAIALVVGTGGVACILKSYRELKASKFDTHEHTQEWQPRLDI